MQPVEEVINPSASGPLVECEPEWNFPDEDEPSQQQQQSGDFFAEREFDFPPETNDMKQNDDDNQTKSTTPINNTTESESKIKELEREKEDLQQRLYDAKNALNEYSAKLDYQVINLV